MKTNVIESLKNKEVLISGASISGLCAAWWMHNSGFKVTVVEKALQPRVNGAAVDFKGDTVTVVKRMGILDQLMAHRIHCNRIEFKDGEDQIQYAVDLPEDAVDDIEIERDAFINVLYTDLKPKVTFLFNNSIIALTETHEEMVVKFADSQIHSFHLVLGGDGVHSNVRKLWFGEESRFAQFKQGYGSITILNKLLIKQGTSEIYRAPGKSIYLNAYNGKTDLIFNFFSEHEINFNYRDKAQQRQLIIDQFMKEGWRSAELLKEMRQSDNFYFIDYYQVKMSSWTKGRVALVGDAAYCVTPAAGRGASMAMSGVAALADALQKNHGDYLLAFEEYNTSYRSYVESVQADAEQTLQEVFLPQTEDAVKQTQESLNSHKKILADVPVS